MAVVSVPFCNKEKKSTPSRPRPETKSHPIPCIPTWNNVRADRATIVCGRCDAADIYIASQNLVRKTSSKKQPLTETRLTSPRSRRGSRPAIVYWFEAEGSMLKLRAVELCRDSPRTITRFLRKAREGRQAPP
jgi:hypothetical protein